MQIRSAKTEEFDANEDINMSNIVEEKKNSSVPEEENTVKSSESVNEDSPTNPPTPDNSARKEKNFTPPVKKNKKYDLVYFLQLAFKSMINNVGMTAASLAVLASCLVVMGSFFLVLINVDINLDRVGELNRIIVYCDYDLTEAEVATVESKLLALNNVTSVESVSKDAALEDMISDYYSYSGIFQTMQDENYNPLSDSFVIAYADNEYVGDLVYELSAIDGVRRVNNRAEVSVRVENIRRGIIFIFVGFFAILLVTSLFVIINTIKLALHYRRYDITVMKYVGATNTFILSPFILEGAIIGVLSSLIATIIQMVLYSHIINATKEAFNAMIYLVPAKSCALPVWAAFLLVGILCGLVGSMVSIRKNLKS